MSSEIIRPCLHLPMDRLTSTGLVEDISGNGNHGVITGATRVADRWGRENGAFSFDGVDDDINTQLTFESISDISLIVMAKCISLTANDCFLIGTNVLYNGPSTTNYGIGMFLTGAAGLFSCVAGGDSGLWINDKDTNPAYNYADSRWHVYCITLSNNKMIKYVDGVMLETLTCNYAVRFGGRTFAVGRKPTVGYGSMSQIISDARIYQTGLTPTQVKYLTDTLKRKYGRQ